MSAIVDSVRDSSEADLIKLIAEAKRRAELLRSRQSATRKEMESMARKAGLSVEDYQVLFG